MDDEARRLLTHLQDAPHTELGQQISLLSRLDDLAHVQLTSSDHPESDIARGGCA
jgi:hypothetical protein